MGDSCHARTPEININGSDDSDSHIDTMLTYISIARIPGKTSLPPASRSPLGRVKGGATELCRLLAGLCSSHLLFLPRLPDSNYLLWENLDKSPYALHSYNVSHLKNLRLPRHSSTLRIKSTYGSVHSPNFLTLETLQMLYGTFGLVISKILISSSSPLPPGSNGNLAPTEDSDSLPSL